MNWLYNTPGFLPIRIIHHKNLMAIGQYFGQYKAFYPTLLTEKRCTNGIGSVIFSG